MKKYPFLVLYVLALLSCPITSSIGEVQYIEQLPIETLVLAVAPKATMPTLCVTAHVLTLRTGPGISFRPVTWLPEETKVTQLSSVGNWFEVTTNQYHGWVNSKYIESCP